MAGADAEQQWPPRSPFEALLSSPSGRSRLRKFQDRTSPSPSPLKKAATTPNMNPMQHMVANGGLSSENEDDEDEETLQLRLRALEAKLKLKKLRQKKNKNQTNSSDIENERPESSSRSSETAITSTADKKDWMKLERPVRKPIEPQPVQVPVSPQRKQVQEGAPRSPGRVLLGIDKGLKGKNVSLRRVPESKRSQALDDPFLEDALRSRELAQRSNVHGSRTHGHDLGSRPMTFSERIADTRQRDKEQKEKARRLQDQRSTGFGIGIEALESLRNTANEEAKVTAAFDEQNTAKPTFSREEVLRAASKPNGGLVRRNSTTSANQAVRRRKDFKNPNAPPGFVKSVERPVKAHSPSPPTVKPKSASSKTPASTDPSLFEPFSSVHLTRRLIPHDSLTKAFTGKSILLLPDVLGTVKAPDYSFLDTLEADCVILAIIASKSTPLTHKDNKQHPETAKKPPASTDVPTSSLIEAAESEANERGKYMALTLTDLKWSLDLYLFTSAFTRWRKLAPGTVIAILNPNIMPPPPHNPHNNRFSLTLNSNDDTILEIGTSRDLSWCSSVKKDGKQCDAWIDKRHTSVCEFHVDRVIEKSRRGRMEINGVSVPFGPCGKKGSRSGFWGGSGGGKRHNINSSSWPGGHFDKREEARRNNRRPEGAQYDRSSQTTFFVGGRAPTTGGFGPSAASLLDGDGLAERGGREERVRKRMAEREREREIAKQLGERGKGMGGEYLKIRHQGPEASEMGEERSEGRSQIPVDAASLGLKGNKAGDVQLSPLKKRRFGDVVEGGVRKKTRFVTEKGIREAGRESLGVVGTMRGKENEDDELDIV